MKRLAAAVFAALWIAALATTPAFARGRLIGFETSPAADSYFVDSNKSGYNGAASPSGACATADADTGRSVAHAWCTLARVQTACGGTLTGDSIVNFVNGDTWRESLSCGTLNGSSGHPITFQGYNAGSATPPVFSGADVIPSGSWTLCADCGTGAGSIYWQAVSSTVMGVYVDSPALSWGLSRAGCLPEDSCTAGTPDYTEIAQMVAGSEFYATTTTGHQVAGRLYVWLADSSNPSGHTVEASIRETGFLFNGGDGAHSWTTISTLEFVHYQCHAIRFHDYGSAPGSGMPGVVIIGNIVGENGTGLADHTGYCNAVEYLDEANGTSDSVQIINNSLDACGGHNCIQVHGDRGGSALVKGNEVQKWAHNGIDVKESAPVTVDSNVAHDSASPSYGAIYAEDNQFVGTTTLTAQKNIVYNTRYGMQCSGGSTATHNVVCNAYNNTFYNVTDGIVTDSLTLAGNLSFTLRNNLIDSTTPIYDTSTSTTTTMNEDYNDLGATKTGTITMRWRGTNYTTLAAWRAASGSNGLTVGSHQVALSTDPLWVSPTTDFHLQASSPVKTAGYDLGIGLGTAMGPLSVAP